VQPQQGNSAPPPAEQRDKRVVKRYSNRKLYDTRESRYVTLLQIAEMVRAGEEVQIIDNATKDDLTEVTLAQIIYEEQKQHSRSVPLATLRDLIHQRGERLITQLREGPLGRLLPADDKDKKAEDVAKVASPDEHGTYGGTPPKDEKKEEGEKKGLFKELDERIRSALASFSPFQQMQSEVARLKERIEELESRLRSRGEAPGGSSPQSGKPAKKE